MERKCVRCGKDLPNPWQKKYCSHACRAKDRADGARIERNIPCQICGTICHHRPKRGHGVVCSNDCLRELRRRVGRRNVSEGKIPPHGEVSEEERARRAARMTGPGCPKFNGYRTTTGNGRYILVKAQSNYPYPESVDARGYIREHRMVMEMHLGRALDRREVVHHLNGNSHDNRIENLSLFPGQSEHISHEWETNPSMGR